ncbi:hypothetical protein [Nocardioides pelophilus]|uniref:hypothetical protein n=1 Tax=Nocardioides pelophilus TaxID=2172019 RepID=UPI0015FED479|nr:hypothetical protein [Nocardioides pelophilus]
MTVPRLAGALVAPSREAHVHAWQLVNIETDCGVEVREILCTTCSAVQIQG